MNRRSGEVRPEDVPPQFAGMINLFAFEDYFVWEPAKPSVAKRASRFSKPDFETWVYAHLLKICLPYPRPMRNGKPVYAPLNLASFFSFVSNMIEVGYPAHWLAGILSSICTGVITTAARPPTQRVTPPSEVKARRAPQAFSICPCVAEFTTLLSLWQRLLPFGVDAGSALAAPDKIHP